MFNAFLEPCYPRGIGTNGNRVVAAVALPGTIPLASPKVTDYSIRRQQVALLSCRWTHSSKDGKDRTDAGTGLRQQKARRIRQGSDQSDTQSGSTENHGLLQACREAYQRLDVFDENWSVWDRLYSARVSYRYWIGRESSSRRRLPNRE